MCAVDNALYLHGDNVARNGVIDDPSTPHILLMFLHLNGVRTQLLSRAVPRVYLRSGAGLMTYVMPSSCTPNDGW